MSEKNKNKITTAKEYREIMTELTEATKKIVNSDAFFNTVDSLMVGASAFQKMANKIASDSQKAISSMNLASTSIDFSKYFLGLNEAIKNMSKTIKLLGQKLERDDLFLIPYFNEMFSLGEVVRIFNHPDMSAIQIYDEFFREEKNIHDLLLHWCKNDIFKTRKHILKACLNAHYRKEYALSIPVLLAQIEGIHDEVFRKSIKKNIKKHKKFKYNASEEIFGEKNFYYLVENMFGSTTNSTWQRQYPNRNIVLHGKDINYFKKRYYSLYLILVLDYLSDIKI